MIKFLKFAFADIKDEIKRYFAVTLKAICSTGIVLGLSAVTTLTSGIDFIYTVSAFIFITEIGTQIKLAERRQIARDEPC